MRFIIFKQHHIQTTTKLAIVERYPSTENQNMYIITHEQLTSEHIIVFNPYVNDMIISAGHYVKGGNNEISIWELVEVHNGEYQFTKKHVFESKLNCKRNWKLPWQKICEGFVTRFKISPLGDKLAVVGWYELAKKLRILNIPKEFDELGNWYSYSEGLTSTIPIQLMSNLKLRF